MNNTLLRILDALLAVVLPILLKKLTNKINENEK